MISAAQSAYGVGDYTSSIGLVVKADGTVQDSIPGMPAFESGISPYMRIIGVSGHQFSMDELNSAVTNAKAEGTTITLLVANAGLIETHPINYSGGLRDPHLVQPSSACRPAR